MPNNSLKTIIFINKVIDIFKISLFCLLDGENVGSIGKLVSGIILLIVGVLIAYEAYVYTLKDLILVVGVLIALVGIIIIISYVVDSSVSKSNDRFKEYVSKLDNSSNFFNSEPKKDDKPLKIRTEFDNYEEEYYGDSYDESYFQNNEDVEEVNEFGESLDFAPYYKKPVKITRPPKKREKSLFAEDISNLETSSDKSNLIEQALNDVDAVEDVPVHNTSNKEQRNIKIDINDPESLPIPKSLNSYIVGTNQIVTSTDAFEQLGSDIKKEVMLEIPSLNDLSDRFLSYIPSIYSRVIIEEFDVSNISYMILIASLLKQGVHIKTIPKVNTINLITDDSQAMILSKGRKPDDIEYGAIYDDRNVLSEIRSTFERTWEIAEDLDENILLKYMGHEGV